MLTFFNFKILFKRLNILNNKIFVHKIIKYFLNFWNKIALKINNKNFVVKKI